MSIKYFCNCCEKEFPGGDLMYNVFRKKEPDVDLCPACYEIIIGKAHNIYHEMKLDRIRLKAIGDGDDIDREKHKKLIDTSSTVIKKDIWS
jgi:hypothetical protein